LESYPNILREINRRVIFNELLAKEEQKLVSIFDKETD
jgi:hypothetical protein